MSPTNYFGEDDDLASTWTLYQIYADMGSFQDVVDTLQRIDPGVTHRRMRRWVRDRERYRCPHPIRRIAHLDLYSLQEWRDWYRVWLIDHPVESAYRRVRRVL